jgi:uncharacterized membrane protein
MDRKLLKQNARMSFKRKHGASIVVAFIMSIFAGGSSFSFNLGSGGSTDTDYYNESFSSFDSFDAMLSSIPQEFLIGFITGLVGVACIFSLAGIFLAPIFTVGGNRFFMKLRKGVNTGIGEVTGNFRDGNYWNIVKIIFVKNLKIALWSLLLLIPGIVKLYEYFLVDYILAVRPDIDRKSAFAMSKNLMDGHKADAFVLGLSFIGWSLLGGLFTCGILNIAYVNPYLYATLNEFYAFVRAEGIRNGIITPMDLPDYEAPMQYGYDMNNGFGFNPQAPTFNGGFQNQYQAPQEAPQTPFWQQSNEPVGNVDTMPNEAPISEADAKEVEFESVDENE